jgi:AcrR family transcriptional regulator
MKEHDLRNRRTRENLRRVLAELLKEEDFEKITVKELCEHAGISRITFYNHYGDKYELLEDVFRRLDRELKEDLQRRQAENNPDDDPLIGYGNLLDSCLDQYFSMEDVARHVSIQKNNIVLNPYYHLVMDNIACVMEHYEDRLRPNFPSGMLCSFLALGFYGCIRNLALKCGDEKKARLKNIVGMFRAILLSGMFTLTAETGEYATHPGDL